MIKLDKIEQQVVLYCKGHFLVTDIMEDLRVLVSNAYRLPLDETKDYSIYHYMVELGFKLIDEYRRQRMIFDLFKHNKTISYIDMIMMIKSEIASLQVYKNDEILIELGDADFSLLPKHERENNNGKHTNNI